jgi:hypothetical protein
VNVTAAHRAKVARLIAERLRANHAEGDRETAAADRPLARHDVMLAALALEPTGARTRDPHTCFVISEIMVGLRDLRRAGIEIDPAKSEFHFPIAQSITAAARDRGVKDEDRDDLLAEAAICERMVRLLG